MKRVINIHKNDYIQIIKIENKYLFTIIINTINHDNIYSRF